MVYPFDPIEHCTYRKTFLKDVRVAVKFSKVDLSKVDKDALQSFYSIFSPDGVDLDSIPNKDLATFSSKDNTIVLKFGSDYSDVTLCTPSYSSFESSKP